MILPSVSILRSPSAVRKIDSTATYGLGFGTLRTQCMTKRPKSSRTDYLFASGRKGAQGAGSAEVGSERDREVGEQDLAVLVGGDGDRVRGGPLALALLAPAEGGEGPRPGLVGVGEVEVDWGCSLPDSEGVSVGARVVVKVLESEVKVDTTALVGVLSPEEWKLVPVPVAGGLVWPGVV